MKSSSVVASGKTTRSTDELLMSRSCQSAWFSIAGRGVAAHHAREAADVLEAPGVALVRHRGGALLARAELLLDLAHLGARQVAELDGELLEARGDQRERREQRGVAIALHDLGGHRLEADAEPRADRRLHVRREVREGADGAGDLSDRGLGERAREPRLLAPHLLVEHEQLEPEGGRLGVHAVGAADAGRVPELERAAPQHVAHARRRPRAAARPRRGSASASAVSSVSLEVMPKCSQRAGSAHRLGDLRQERDHVVAHLALDLGHARHVDARPRAQLGGRRGRHHAARGELVGDGELDLEPALVAALVAPDRLHLRPCVALDHDGPSRRKT